MNKVLITVYVPTLEEEYNLFIPINKKIGTIKNKIKESIFEMSEGNFDVTKKYRFFDRETGKDYEETLYVKESGIKNGSKIILM